MSAHPGDPADRRPLPPFAPALSRPSGSPDAAPAAGAPLPPFAPFARPAAAQPAPAPAAPAAEEAGSVVDEYARAPEPPSAVEEEAAPFTPAATGAEDEAWMPWEAPVEAGPPLSDLPAAGDDAEDLPWLSAGPAMHAEPTLQEPAFQEPAFQEPAAEEEPAWMTWGGQETEAEAPAAESSAGEAYSFDVDSFGAAPQETPVPDATSFDAQSYEAAPSDAAAEEPPAFGADAPFAFAAGPESGEGESPAYAADVMAPLDAADAFPEAAEEPVSWDSGAPVHVSEAEAAPEAVASPWEPAPAAGEAEDTGAESWSTEFAVEEPASSMEEYLASEENTAAEEALYAPAGDADYAAGDGYASDYTESEPGSDYASEYAGTASGDDDTSGYAESASGVLGGFDAPFGESAFAGEAPFVGDAGEAVLAGGTADALAEVAERLEGIARRLREQPDEVLAGGAGTDPLELLVTGFALGYAQGRRGAR
jgi:hypothetical protein